MKTSLICLLLLAAVACAAPRAGEMAEEKHEAMAEEKRGKMTEEKREEMSEKKREEIAEEKREEVDEEKSGEMAEEQRDEEAAAALAPVEEEQRQYSPCYGPCPNNVGETSCYFDGCYSTRRYPYGDWLYTDYFHGYPCPCCVTYYGDPCLDRYY